MNQILEVLLLLFAWVMIFIAGHGLLAVLVYTLGLAYSRIWPPKEPDDHIHLTLVDFDEDKWK